MPGLIRDLGSEQKLVRSHVVSVLASLGASQAAPHIAKLADDPVDTVRMCAVDALGVLKAHEFEGTLVAALDDSASVVRMSAAEALGRMAARDTIPSLRRALDNDPNPEVRLHAVESLVLLGDQQSRERVPQVLREISWRVRLHPRWKKLRKVVETGEPLTPWPPD